MRATPIKRGRPRLADPRVSCHVPLSRDERAACNLAARRDGLAFAAWARQTLLARIRVEAEHGLGYPERE